MNLARSLASIVVALILTACAGGGSGSGDPAGAARTTRFDGETLRIAVLREDGGTERFSSARDEWFTWSWRPFLPNHAGRRWALRKARTEGTSVAYALVSWDNDEPTDYLAAGYWLWFPGADDRRLRLEAAETAPFIDGPELDPASPPRMPLSGTATYAGEAGGVYSYRYGSGWAGIDEPEFAEEFAGTISLTADFADGTVSGCIGCIGDLEIRRAHLYTLFGYRVEQPLAQPTDYEVHFGRTRVGANGAFENPDATVRHPGRAVAQSSGSWSGTFSNRSDANGHPRLVAGTARAEFVEADGSEGSFNALFTALGDSLRPPAPSEEESGGPVAGRDTP